MKNSLLAEKVIVIIGGTTGLGFSAAKAFVLEGAKVIVVGRDSKAAARAEKQLGPAAAAAMAADATHPETAEAAISQAVDLFGGFHGLYHVAGGSGRGQGDGPLHKIPDDGWHQTLHHNLDAVFYSNRAAAIRFMSQGKGGSILNMGSVLAFSPSPGHFATHAYATAKAAIIGLTRSAAAFYAPHNIRFNLLASGLVATPMSQRAQEDPAVLDFINTKQPLDGGRIGHPSDCDAAAVYFLSDASRFVTGQVLGVDGGWTVSEGQLT